MDPYGRPQLAQPPPPPPPQQQPSKYKLQIEQQPVRARMCGFGDKDRRPITPPPCIRLVIAEDVLRELKDHDGSSFILMVDLWSEDGRSAVNLVRSSNTAATVSISSSDISSYPPPQINMPSQPMGYMGHRMQPQLPYAPQYGAPAQPYGYGNPPAQQYYQQVPAQMPISASSLAPSQNHTRNLIGMNAVNACQLNDLDGEKGYWFILQDLSVRTEGTFRLKLSVVDISAGNGQINTGKCPILCHAFSEPFTVYSAKKFPGVIESTPLSKCFASQGIKIPIRKDGPKNISNQAEYDADD